MSASGSSMTVVHQSHLEGWEAGSRRVLKSFRVRGDLKCRWLQHRHQWKGQVEVGSLAPFLQAQKYVRPGEKKKSDVGRREDKRLHSVARMS